MGRGPATSTGELGAIGGAERAGRLEQPGQRLLELSDARFAFAGRQIPFDVLDGTGQHVQLVAQTVKGVSGDDQFLVP